MPTQKDDPQTAFARAHIAGDLPAAVELARHQAKREILSGGVEYDSMSFAETLAGELKRDPDSNSVPWASFCRFVYAAYALGIVTGQLVHPDVFKSGGAR